MNVICDKVGGHDCSRRVRYVATTPEVIGFFLHFFRHVSFFFWKDYSEVLGECDL